MADTNETRADIIAEMRENKGFSVPFTQDGVKAVWRADLVDYADRFEAAANREMSKNASKKGADFGQLGNMAAMREACQMMSDLFDKGVICTSYANTADEMDQIEELYHKAKAALAAPARECDRFADEKQADALHAAFIEYCDGCDCPMGCDYRKNPRFLLNGNCASILKCFARFSLSKATLKKEGGEK